MRSNYIGGSWVPSAGDAGVDVVNPATEQIIDSVPAGHPADVDAAVLAARSAFAGWSADMDHAVAVGRRLRAGQVEINGGAFNVAAPFGGYGQSGYGRELGVHGLEEYLELKALQF